MANNPLFFSTSTEKPTLLSISFESDPKGSLGAQLSNCDKGATHEMFIPGYAAISRLLEGDTVARQSGVQVGDIIVAVNGQGFRRFAPDYKEDEVENLSKELDEKMDLSDKAKTIAAGKAYDSLLAKIKEIKAAGDSASPLFLSLERYGWDARPNSWKRFLDARDGDVPAAMQMIQNHETWCQETFPIDLTNSALQKVFQLKAVAEIDIHSSDLPPVVYVNYGKLQTLEEGVNPEDVVKAFVIFTEMMLKRSPDPRTPQTCQFIDLSGVSITSGFRVDILKKIYSVFEPNYPETLCKMVVYPVSTMASTTAKGLLSFVNDKTRSKFIITGSLEKVCAELGWDQKEVEECGGVSEFFHKHEKASDAMIFN